MHTTLFHWTVDDYHRTIAAGILDDRRVELITGQIYSRVPESPEHTYREQSLADLLHQALRDRACIRENKPVTFSDSEPEPDIAIARGTARDYLQHHPSGSDLLLVIEISNTTLQTDITIKRDLYARAGIPEYWVVDLKHRQIERFWNLNQSQYQQQQTINTGNIAPIAFPDVQIAIAELFR